MVNVTRNIEPSVTRLASGIRVHTQSRVSDLAYPVDLFFKMLSHIETNYSNIFIEIDKVIDKEDLLPPT
jgi:hypothetical protein